MPELDETLDPAASVENIEEQPAEEVQAVEPSTQVEEQAPEEIAQETPTPRLYAGKYKTPEELEAAYASTSAESSRMSQELASLRKAPKTEEKPKYSATQLETWKSEHFLGITNAQGAAQRAYAAGNIQEAQQFEKQARESAYQISLIDAELRKIDIANSMQSTQRSVAEGKILAEARGVLQQYQADLVPGTELFEKASEFMQGYQALGHDVESPLVQAHAVSLAAQILGVSVKKAERTTRKELTQNITQALKAGVQAGAGKASKSASASPDFLKMTDAEFIAYKQSKGMS